jgi:hypothetical protein
MLKSYGGSPCACLSKGKRHILKVYLYHSLFRIIRRRENLSESYTKNNNSSIDVDRLRSTSIHRNTMVEVRVVGNEIRK